MWQMILAGTLIVGATNVEVNTLEGETASGVLTSLATEGVTIEAADGQEQTFQPGELQGLTVTNPAARIKDKPAALVDLTDGTQLLTKAVSVGSGMVKTATLDGKPLEVSKRVVHSLRLKEQDARLSGQWKKIEADETEGDLLVVRKNPKGEDGKLPYLDYLEGIVLGITDKTVAFEFDGERIDVPIAKVEGVIYFHADDEKTASPLCSLTDNAGSTWKVRTAETDDNVVTFTTVSGLTRKMEAGRIVTLDFSGGNRIYLGSLEPVDFQWFPFFKDERLDDKASRLLGFQRDRAITGGKITLGGKSYPKGVAIPSKSELIYAVPDDFRHFKAIVGIDDATRPRGHVTLEITGDGRSLLEKKTISGKDEPFLVDLDVTGVKRLKIVVGYGRNFDVGDHLDFANARFTK